MFIEHLLYSRYCSQYWGRGVNKTDKNRITGHHALHAPGSYDNLIGNHSVAMLKSTFQWLLPRAIGVLSPAREFLPSGSCENSCLRISFPLASLKVQNDYFVHHKLTLNLYIRLFFFSVLWGPVHFPTLIWSILRVEMVSHISVSRSTALGTYQAVYKWSLISGLMSSAPTVHREAQYEENFTLERRNPKSASMSVSLFPFLLKLNDASSVVT